MKRTATKTQTAIPAKENPAADILSILRNIEPAKANAILREVVREIAIDRDNLHMSLRQQSDDAAKNLEDFIHIVPSIEKILIEERENKAKTGRL